MPDRTNSSHRDDPQTVFNPNAPITHGEMQRIMMWPLRNLVFLMGFISFFGVAITWSWKTYTASAVAAVALYRSETKAEFNMMHMEMQANDARIEAKVDTLIEMHKGGGVAMKSREPNP